MEKRDEGKRRGRPGGRTPASFRLLPRTKVLLELLSEATGEPQGSLIDEAVFSLATERGLVVGWTDDEIRRARAGEREWVATFTYPDDLFPGAADATKPMEALSEAIEAHWFAGVTGLMAYTNNPSYLEIRFVLPPARKETEGEIRSQLVRDWHGMTAGRGHVNVRRATPGDHGGASAQAKSPKR